MSRINIKKLAEKINEKQNNYKIGELPNIRKKIHNLRRVGNEKIFSSKSIKGDYAFHSGGGAEIQFNIGYEGETFRCGLAFSLYTTQSLTDPVKEIVPKIRKFNFLVRSNQIKIKGYEIWYYRKEEEEDKKDLHANSPIPEKCFKKENFISIGKELDIKKMNLDELSDEILTIFDDLLPIYIKVESEDEQIRDAIILDDTKTDGQKVKIRDEKESTFKFKPPTNEPNLRSSTKYHRNKKTGTVHNRHSQIQTKLCDTLVKKYGKKNVKLEHPYGSRKIDLVVKKEDGCIFYEIKTNAYVGTCIREALGQILEYAYSEGKENAKKLIIVGDPPLDKKNKKYLAFLRKKFSIPIYYEQAEIN